MSRAFDILRTGRCARDVRPGDLHTHFGRIQSAVLPKMLSYDSMNDDRSGQIWKAKLGHKNNACASGKAIFLRDQISTRAG